jgi:BlaI family transcriptional regulator, penicillinase repressor
MRAPKTVPTDQELEILKVIWRRGQATVRQVHEDLSQKRKVAYTTVLTMMGILEQKGHLKKRALERAYVYSPAQPERQVVERMVDEFVDRVFNGASKPLLAHLVDDPEISAEDLKEIEALLKAKRRKP